MLKEDIQLILTTKRDFFVKNLSVLCFLKRLSLFLPHVHTDSLPFISSKTDMKLSSRPFL